MPFKKNAIFFQEKPAFKTNIGFIKQPVALTKQPEALTKQPVALIKQPVAVSLSLSGLQNRQFLCQDKQP